ncbi:MAG: ATP-binding protein [Bdellovibrionales bacterium]
MSALFESVDDGIIVGDIKGRILFGNSAALRINDNSDFAISPEERILHYVANDGEDFQMKVSDLPLQRALTEGEVRGLELTLVTPIGRKKNLICNGRALFNSKGEKVGAVLVVRDRTQEKTVEQHKIRLEKERTELLRMNEELERFASVAAHDLKSPLNSITQLVELLSENLAGKVSADEGEILRYISNATSRLRSLIDDLLAYARSGKNLGEITSVDLCTVLDNVVSSLRGDLKAAKARLDIGPMPIVMGDRVGLFQVFQNLVANAVKYKSERHLEVNVRSHDNGDCWRFEISDNGKGIREEDQAVAFELFKRFDESSKSEGTGLGLPICRRIIKAHGGAIWLESKKGMGTTIIFILPKSGHNPSASSPLSH